MGRLKLSYDEREKMKEKKLLIIIIALAIIIILGIGGMVAAFMLTDIMKTNKQLFIKYIAKNIEQIEQLDDDDLENYIKKQESNSYSNEGKITANISGETTDKTLNMLKNASITFSGGIDSANNYRYQNIDVNYSDTEKINLEYIQMQDHYGVKINDVTNKFITVENNNLKEFATKMGMPTNITASIPDKLNFNVNTFENLFSDAEIDQIKNKYLKVIEPELTDEMFIKNKENDSTIYMLTLTDAKLKAIASKILTTLKDDELIVSKFKQIVLSNSGMTEESANEYIEQFKQGLQEEIDDVNNQDNIASEDNSITAGNNVNIKVYVKKGNLEKTEISITNRSEKLTITNIKNGIQVEAIGEDSDKSVAYAIEKIKNSEGLTYNMVASESNKQLASISMKYNGLNTDQVQEKVEVNLDMVNILTVVKRNLLANSKIGTSGPPSVGETQNQGSSINSDTNNETTELTNGNVILLYENSKKFDNNLQKQNITTSDMIVLNTAPNIESITNLLTKVWERFLQVNTERLTKAMSSNPQNNTTNSTWDNASSEEGAENTNTTTNDTNTSTENNNTNTNTDANGITMQENNMVPNSHISNYGKNVINQITN